MTDPLKNNRDSKIFFMIIFILFGFISSVYFHYYQGLFLGKPYPYNTFLFAPQISFSDFFDIINAIKSEIDPYENRSLNIAYGPAIVIIFKIFTLFRAKYSFIFTILIFIFSLNFLIFNFLYKKVKNENLVIFSILITFFSYPALFLLNRGNVEMLNFSLLCFFIYFKKNNKNIFASLALALAGACKIQMLIFALFFFQKNTKKYFFSTFIFCFLFYLLGFFIIGLIWDSPFLNVIKAFFDSFFVYVVPIDRLLYLHMQHNHSIWSMIQSLNVILKWGKPADFIKNYSLFAGLFLMVSSLWIGFIENNEWKKITLTTIILLFLPAISFDYTMMSWIFPILYFIENDHPLTNHYGFKFLFSIFMIPVGYKFILNDISISTIIYPVSFSLIFILIFYSTTKNLKKVTKTNLL